MYSPEACLPGVKLFISTCFLGVLEYMYGRVGYTCRHVGHVNCMYVSSLCRATGRSCRKCTAPHFTPSSRKSEGGAPAYKCTAPAALFQNIVEGTSLLFRRLCRSEISLLALYLQVNNSWHVGHVCTTLTVKRAEINMPNLITYRKSYLALSTCLRSRSVLKYLESSGLIIWGYYTYIGIIHFDFRKMVLLS